MKPNYNRCEEYGLNYEEYSKEYERRYPNGGGPAHKTDCGEAGGKDCGCWICRSLAWGLQYEEEVEKSELYPNHSNSVFKTVMIVLFVMWMIVKFFGGLNEEYFKKNEMYRPRDVSTEKHWLYK